ncbi:hypothetical protein AKJ16_DCAP16307 [Drosera capensis]
MDWTTVGRQRVGTAADVSGGRDLNQKISLDIRSIEIKIPAGVEVTLQIVPFFTLESSEVIYFAAVLLTLGGAYVSLVAGATWAQPLPSPRMKISEMEKMATVAPVELSETWKVGRELRPESESQLVEVLVLSQPAEEVVVEQVEADLPLSLDVAEVVLFLLMEEAEWRLACTIHKA